MRALRIDTEGQVRLTDSAPEPMVAPGDALVQVRRVLLTHLDAVAAGLVEAPAYSGTLGHLFVGAVKRAEEDPARRGAATASNGRGGLVGKRVVASPSIACAQCDLCRAGLSMHCRHRRVIGVHGHEGCCASLVSVPLANLLVVPDSVPDERAVFAHPLACTLHAAHMLHSANKAYVTVLGDGLEALLAAQAMARVNKSVRLLSTRPDRARLCERWGVRHRPVHEAGLRQDQDAVVDCTGSPAGLATALQMVRPRGVVLVQSALGLMPVPAGKPRPVVGPGGAGASKAGADEGRPSNGAGDPWVGAAGPNPDLALAAGNEVQILGCREGPLPDALALLCESGSGAVSGGGIDIAGLCPASGTRCRLEQAPSALLALRDPAALPHLIEIDPSR